MNSTTHRRSLVVLALGLAVAGTAGCGSSSSSAGSASSVSSAVSTTTQTSTPDAGTTPSSEATGTSGDASSTTGTGASGESSTSGNSSTSGGASTSQPTASSTRSSSTGGSDHGTQGSGSVALHVELAKASEIPAKLPGTTQSFRAFLAPKLKRTDGCPAPGVEVSRWWYAGDQAMGSVNNCAGYSAIWFRPSGGAWKEIGFQAVDSCDSLKKQGVPHAIPASTGFRCTTASGRSVAYDPATA